MIAWNKWVICGHYFQEDMLVTYLFFKGTFWNKIFPHSEGRRGEFPPPQLKLSHFLYFLHQFASRGQGEVFPKWLLWKHDVSCDPRLSSVPSGCSVMSWRAEGFGIRWALCPACLDSLQLWWRVNHSTSVFFSFLFYRMGREYPPHHVIVEIKWRWR